jgi:hypothetical protein
MASKNLITGFENDDGSIGFIREDLFLAGNNLS